MNMSSAVRKCPTCGEQFFGLVTTQFETSADHDGKEYLGSSLDLVIFSRRARGNQLVPDASEEQLMFALRQAAVLLTPEEIRDNRLRIGLSREKLASVLGVTEDTLSRWEAGLLIQTRALDNYLRNPFSLPPIRPSHSKSDQSIVPAVDSTSAPVLS